MAQDRAVPPLLDADRTVPVLAEIVLAEIVMAHMCVLSLIFPSRMFPSRMIVLSESQLGAPMRTYMMKHIYPFVMYL